MFHLHLLRTLTILLGLVCLCSSNAMAERYPSVDYRLDHPEYQKVDPNRVRIESRLIGRLDWGYDSYYEIDLFIDDVKVASTSEDANLASEKIHYARNTVLNARVDGKFLEIDTSLFHPHVQMAIKTSDESLPVVQKQTDQCGGNLDGRPMEEQHVSLFERLFKHVR